MAKKRIHRYAAIVVASIVGLAGPARASDYSKDKAAILRIEHNIAAAQTSAELVKYLAPDFVFDDFSPGEVRGIAAVSADLAKQFSVAEDIKDEILELSADADHHLGYAYSIQHMSFTDKPSHARIDIVFRQTDLYRKSGNNWQMVYQHLSLPADFKTGKFVTNATPPKE